MVAATSPRSTIGMIDARQLPSGYWPANAHTQVVTAAPQLGDEQGSERFRIAEVRALHAIVGDDAPARGAQAPTEVDVLAGLEAHVEATELVERLRGHRQVSAAQPVDVASARLMQAQSVVHALNPGAIRWGVTGRTGGLNPFATERVDGCVDPRPSDLVVGVHECQDLTSSDLGARVPQFCHTGSRGNQCHGTSGPRDGDGVVC